MSIAIDELLLQVQKKEVEIFELNLTELAQSFRLQEPMLYPGAKFIAGLAHLIYLKAQKLVPQEEELPQEAEDFEALRLHAVEEYASFREVAKTFSLKEREQTEMYWRPTQVAPQEELARPLYLPVDLEEFSRLFLQIWQQAKERSLCIYEEEWSVADALKVIRHQLSMKDLRIHELFAVDYSKERLIVSFLAVLELLKNQEAALVKQDTVWMLICP